MATIILVHGFLGFSQLPGDCIKYFRGVKEQYEAGGVHQVYCPDLGPLGVVAERVPALAKFIRDNIPATAGGLHLIAHSRGGIDCRVMLATNADIASRTHRLVTIATPHFGTPVASNALLQPSIPTSLNPLSFAAPGLLASLKELTPAAVPQVQDVPSIRYLRIACDADGLVLAPLPFGATQTLGAFGTLPNDGLVGLDSALKDAGATSPQLKSWNTDHAAAVGWPTDAVSLLWRTRFLEQHKARYDALLPALLA